MTLLITVCATLVIKDLSLPIVPAAHFLKEEKPLLMTLLNLLTVSLKNPSKNKSYSDSDNCEEYSSSNKSNKLDGKCGVPLMIFLLMKAPTFPILPRSAPPYAFFAETW